MRLIKLMLSAFYAVLLCFHCSLNRCIYTYGNTDSRRTSAFFYLTVLVTAESVMKGCEAGLFGLTFCVYAPLCTHKFLLRTSSAGN